jgi:hypothetical protein
VSPSAITGLNPYSRNARESSINLMAAWMSSPIPACHQIGQLLHSSSLFPPIDAVARAIPNLQVWQQALAEPLMPVHFATLSSSRNSMPHNRSRLARAPLSGLRETGLERKWERKVPGHCRPECGQLSKGAG